MNINQPRILAVAALLALAGLATPTTAQIDPEACITGIFTELPSPSGAGCTPEEPEPCPEGSTGVTDPLCIPDDADPTAGVPCLDPEAEGCPTEGGNPTGCEPDVPEAFLTCLVDFLTGQDPGVDALVCSTLESSETTADACLTEAIEGATTCAEGSEGTFPDCDNTLAGATSCEEGAEGSFPDCDGTVAALVAQVLSALAPTADAGTDESANEGSDVTLDGSLSASKVPVFTMTFNWEQLSGTPVTLVDDETATPSFTAPVFDGINDVLTFELTASDEAGSSTDTVVVTVLDINPVADAGTAFETNEGTANVALDGSGSAGSTADAPTFLWEQVSGPTVTLVGADSATPTFDAPLLDGLQTEVVFDLTVSDPYGSDSASVTVTVLNVGTGSSTAIVSVGEGLAELTLNDPNPTVAAGASETPVTYTADLEDINGLEDVVDESMAFTVTGPQGLSVSEGVDSIVDSRHPDFPNGPEDIIRRYAYDLTFPARLADGTYSVLATYEGVGPDPAGFTVANVAPTIEGTLGNHAGRASFAGTTAATSVSVDDLNWGSYDGVGVTELDSLTFTVTDSLDNVIATGFTFEHDLNNDETFEAGTLDLSALTDMVAIDIPLRVAYDNTVLDGLYTVTATVTDDDGDFASFDVLSILLVPANYGFTIGLSDATDGFNGIVLNGGNDVSPDGSVYDTESDPLAIEITGTLGASTLELGIADFTSGETDDVISVEGVTVRIYSDGQVIGTDEPAFTGTVADNLLVVDLLASSLGASLSTLSIVLDVQVLPGADAANYSSVVDVLTFADE